MASDAHLRLVTYERAGIRHWTFPYPLHAFRTDTVPLFPHTLVMRY